MTAPATGELMARALRELQRAQQRIDELERRQLEPIAIVGAACRLPSAIDSPAALWQFLRRGGDGTGPIPAARWDVEHFHDPRPGQPGRIAARRAACLHDIAGFDADFFGIAPREAELMDPQQRLLLETTWHAFEDAGVAVDSLAGAPVGVFVGISTTDYAYHLVQRVPVDAVTGHCGTGTAHSVAAGRIAYCLDLRGPCVAIDTACSSSLVALHLACQSLRAGECEYAVVAGVNAMLSPLTGASFSHARMLAPDGRCKTFDAAADGYGRGEGAVAVLLARNSDVAARGLRARAEIVGSASNQDGRSAGLTVPNGAAQVAVIRSALAAARVPPSAIDVVEAHGTGTALGDPIELQALASVFAERPAERPLLVSSVKTNLGHAEAAAGVLALLKATLQLEHGEVAPHLHLHEPNPHVAWSRLPLRVPTAAEPWPHAGQRHAGVSSFGFSGTNVHVVLRGVARPQAGHANAAPTAWSADQAVALPVAAADDAALQQLAAAYRARLDAGASALDLAFSAANGRTALRRRAVVLGHTAAELAAALGTVVAGHVHGAALDPELAQAAKAYVDGDKTVLVERLKQRAGRRTDAPLYPFQHQRYWYDGEHGAVPQRLVLRRVTLPPPVVAAAPRRLAVTGSLPATVAAALRRYGCSVQDGDAPAGDRLYVAAPVAPADAALAIVAFTTWLQRSTAVPGSLPRLLVLVDAAAAQAPVAFALRAALRAATAELASLRARGGAASSEADAEVLAATLLAGDDETECEVHGARREGLRLSALPPGAGSAALQLRADCSYLVTGGTGAVGRRLVAHLLERGARHVVCLQRRSDSVPAELVRAAAAHAATLEAVAGDVGDAGAIAQLLAAVDRSGRPLAGVFHLAGVADDALLQDLAPARMAAHLRPKLDGALQLHAAVRDRQLDQFVVFSSAAAWLGNPGQVAYAAANGAVEGLCHWRREVGLPAQALAFGPWAATGMAAAAGVVDRLRSYGVQLLDPTQALLVGVAALQLAASSVAIVRVDWRWLAERRGDVPARLRDLVGSVPPRATVRRSPPTDRAAMARELVAMVASVLGRVPDTIDLATPFAELGLDSLLAVELQQRLQTELGLDATLGTILRAGHCQSLASELVATIGTARTPPTDLRAFVEQLSDDEVRAMLADPKPPGAPPP